MKNSYFHDNDFDGAWDEEEAFVVGAEGRSKARRWRNDDYDAGRREKDRKPRRLKRREEEGRR